jgi:4-carboxymuconolactone decarboxylase
MSRLETLTHDHLDDAQRRMWAAVTGSRGQGVVNDGGGLIGPFDPWLRSPVIGEKLAEAGALLRFSSELEPRLLELVICTVGAHWRSNFEFWAHARLARRAGIDDAVIDALASGREPPLERDDDTVVYQFTRRLLEERRVPDDLCQRALDLLGEKRVVEMVCLAGYYSLVSCTLNAFQVPLPAGESPLWPE